MLELNTVASIAYTKQAFNCIRHNDLLGRMIEEKQRAKRRGVLY
jgi:hypothetical protein